MPYTIDIPGAFHSFLSGTGAISGDLYSSHPEQERGARELRAAFLSSRSIPRGRGYSLRLELPSLHAVVVLAEYAEACLTANSDAPDHSEVAAARAIFDRCAKVTEGRVTYDGWNVRLDGEVLPL